MIASGRDVVATIVVGGAMALAWAHVSGADWPLVGSARTTAGLVYVLGVIACASGSAEAWQQDRSRRRWYHPLGSLTSLAATAALVWALISGSSAAVVMLAIVVAVKWAFATVRHLVTPARSPA
ncbi:hypothetical protein [Demequina lignilytica]|uniref:Uncharacterized protein n=1 Tax=Demequina lignilytica TaxID=3051663 RepID=A0AB35MKL1_9MICO|nr:hypothetical protein [Demequina sp. SYSU T0a273]MDN4484355.1 hypothetical protein [Demequina sp. SYSU T0a273]